MGAQDTWHLWTHGLLCLFLNISRAQRLPLHLTIYHYSAQLLTCQQDYLISFLPILEDHDTSLFYFPRRANLVMQHFFFSSLSTKPQRKTKLNSLLCSSVPLIMKGEFSSALQSHFKIQISKQSSSVILIPVHKGVLGTEG